MEMLEAGNMKSIICLRGGGDLASGVALRLHRVGLKVLITELAQPLAVRRLVSFSEAIYEGEVFIEGVRGRRVDKEKEVSTILKEGGIPILVDPDLAIRNTQDFLIVAIVDARMRKRPPEIGREAAPLVIGLGPGFAAGKNCHAVIETNRGHFLGRVIWNGEAEADTKIPGKVGEQCQSRVLRSPCDGILSVQEEIGSLVREGNVIAVVKGEPVEAPFDGVLRGLLRDGFPVYPGMKIGDLDPRGNPQHVVTVSEKSLAIGGGVLEALLTLRQLREKLWN